MYRSKQLDDRLTDPDGMLTEAEVIERMGRERFDRLLGGGWLSPGYRTKGFQGRPTYPRHYVEMRLAEDQRLHPDGDGSQDPSDGDAPTHREAIIDRYQTPEEDNGSEGMGGLPAPPALVEEHRRFKRRFEEIFGPIERPS
jgi:hypothetical protein